MSSSGDNGQICMTNLIFTKLRNVAVPVIDQDRSKALFEEFGFNYIGPIDGHDLDALIPTLANIKKLKGPQFLHVVTRKGQG